MGKFILRKLLLVVFLIIPFFLGPSCHKQAKCGCDGDKLSYYSFEKALISSSSNGTIPYLLYNETGKSASIYKNHGCSMYYPDTYTLCNPQAIFPIYEKALKDGFDTFIVSGDAFWNCNYSMNSSDYTYSSYLYPCYFDLYITSIEPYNTIYGK